MRKRQGENIVFGLPTHLKISGLIEHLGAIQRQTEEETGHTCYTFLVKSKPWPRVSLIGLSFSLVVFTSAWMPGFLICFYNSHFLFASPLFAIREHHQSAKAQLEE